MNPTYLAVAPALWGVAMAEYIFLNRGYTLRSVARMALLYALTALLAVLPMAVAERTPAATPLGFAALAAGAYQLAFPLIYSCTHRRAARRRINWADPAMGMCLFGVLTAMLLAGGAFAWIVGPLEIVMLATVIVQITYFALYGECMDAYGFRLMTQTNTNEVIEFIRYYPLWMSVAVAMALLGILCASVRLNLPALPLQSGLEAVELSCAAALCMAAACAGGRRSIAARSAFISFYLAKLDNTRRLTAYPGARALREQGIDARPAGKPYDGPSTIILVIGESANRDYLSAFNPALKRDTTPWMNAGRRDDPRHWMIFPNAYSCGMHTFVALEQGLTEKNQFNDIDFVGASSIIDIARASGRRVHWYSNQGHLGASLSQVSVVAEQADEAMWTEQRPGLPPYDAELLPFLDRVDPEADNLVVLHLKGNHFSFENRYPAEAETWRPEGENDTRTTYMNSVRYVDNLLRRVWQTGCDRLNLKAMVYCSDHAIIPDKHRGPAFMGFGDVRIPLAVWTSDDFIAAHPERHAALQANTGRYRTNDFLYELMCGIMDIESPRFHSEHSLAHAAYAHTRDTLTILDGAVRIADDHGDQTPSL